MHELSIATAIVEAAQRHADGRPVAVVSVRVGRLRQVVPDSLRFYFEFAAPETACEHARLELSEIEARLRCEPCGHEWELLTPSFRCPQCGSSEVRILTGEELELDYIEVEDEEPTCTGPK